MAHESKTGFEGSIFYNYILKGKVVEMKRASNEWSNKINVKS